VQAYLEEQVAALLAGDVGLRRGEDVLHPTRVATRRIRATLRSFKRLFGGTEAAEIGAELRWLALALGAVRDAQVLHRLLVGELESLPPEVVLGSARSRIDEALIGTRARRAEELAQLMNSDRYLRLLDSVRLFAAEPPSTPRATRPAAKITKDLRRVGRKFRKRLDAALADGSDESLHRARKAGKRARYAVEAAGPVLPGAAEETIERFKSLQDVLGDQHDAVAAAALLLGVARRADADGFTLGLLYQRMVDRAERLRAALPQVAEEVTAASLTG
jgi:CHAD domain-containing protein